MTSPPPRQSVMLTSTDPRDFSKVDAKELFVWADKMSVPDWIDKNEAKDCGGCKTKIKSGSCHNCRLCGGLFCGDCTGKFQLPAKFEKKGKGLSRVCAGCCRKALILREKVLAEKDVAKQEAVIRASAAPDPQFVQSHLGVVWEDAPTKVVASVPVVETMPLSRVHQSIMRVYAIPEGTFHYLCRGQPVHKVFWDIFVAKFLTPTLTLRRGPFGAGGAADAAVAAADGSDKIKAVAADFSKATELEKVDWNAINKKAEDDKAKEKESAKEVKTDFVKPIKKVLAAANKAPAKVVAPPAGFALEPPPEVERKVQVPKDFKEEKAAPAPLAKLPSNLSGLPQPVQFFNALTTLAVAANGLPALPPPPPGFAAYQASGAAASTLPGMPSDFKLMMPSDIAAQTAAGAAASTGAAGGSGAGGDGGDDEADDGDDGIDEGMAAAPTLSAEQMKQAEQKHEDDDGAASDDEPAPVVVKKPPPAPPPRRTPAAGAATLAPPTGQQKLPEAVQKQIHAPPKLRVSGATKPAPAAAAAPAAKPTPLAAVTVAQPAAAAAVAAPAAAGGEAPLAAGWTEHVNPADKRKYYYNAETKVSTFERPTAAAMAAAAAEGPLPPGWTEHVNPADKRKYYYNAETKVSTFDRPKAAPAAAAPAAAASPTAASMAAAAGSPMSPAAAMMGGMAAMIAAKANARPSAMVTPGAAGAVRPSAVMPVPVLPRPASGNAPPVAGAPRAPGVAPPSAPPPAPKRPDKFQASGF